MQKLRIEPPIVQVAIDVLTIDAALRIGEAAVRAGVDWLEVGTPLVTFAGVAAIGALAQAFPGVPVLADYKIMDGARKYVVEAGRQGGRLATVCAQASDATIRAAIQAGEEAGIAVISDLYNAPDVAARAAEIAAFGLDSVYVHWGADQRAERPERDPLLDLTAVLERVAIPVGVGTFSVADGARAFALGADIGVIGVPLIQAADVEGALRAYVEQGKAAYRRRNSV
jgi:3-hexulose-6-phosphate synthase/6-phospho-3-hexuloisomerase